jgi:cytochrome b pre-mRNA-processing protein 3
VFHRKKPEEAFAAALYARTAGDARAPDLFEACAIPDTLDGRSILSPCMRHW